MLTLHLTLILILTLTLTLSEHNAFLWRPVNYNLAYMEMVYISVVTDLKIL